MENYKETMICPKIRRYRISDIVIAICLPIVFVLSFQASFLSRNLQAVSNVAFTGLQSTGSFETGKPTEENVDVKDSLSTDHENINIDPSNDMPSRYGNVGSVGFPLNNTIRARQDLLVFTTILRSGSTSIRYLLRKLKKENSYIMVASPPKFVDVINMPKKRSQATNAQTISLLNETAAFIGTFAFINFTEFGLQQPVQVSMVRDPLERAISLYYFARAPYRLVENLQRFPEAKLPSRTYLRKSLESCLNAKSDPECLYKVNETLYGNTVEYFCGHEHYCALFGNSDGLQRAKNIVENNFAVVGILEEWEKTVVVLENYVPRFFKGAFKVYKENISSGKVLLNKNIYKAKIDQWARKILKERLSVEYEFYEFLRQRLNQQYEALINREKVPL